MARARNIKPGFFENEELVELPFSTRLLFIGLWTLADREGRLEDRPKRIKMAIFPADNVDVDIALNELQSAGFLLRYEVEGSRYIQILAFKKHQNPHRDERVSTIPAPCEHRAGTVPTPCKHGGNRADSLIPDSPNDDSLIPDTGSPVPVGTDATASISPADALFQIAVPWLVERGMPDKNARSLLGGARKQLGDDGAWRLACECMRDAPMEPAAWLAAALQKRIRGSPSKLGKAGQATAENAKRWLEEQDATH